MNLFNNSKLCSLKPRMYNEPDKASTVVNLFLPLNNHQVCIFALKVIKVFKFDLFDLKKDYPFLFPEHYDNKVWINRLNDSVQKEIYSEVNLVFSNLDNEKDSEEAQAIKNKYFHSLQRELNKELTEAENNKIFGYIILIISVLFGLFLIFNS